MAAAPGCCRRRRWGRRTSRPRVRAASPADLSRAGSGDPADAGDPDDAGERFQPATLRGGALDDTDATYFSAAGLGVEQLQINLNGRGAEQVTVDLTGAGFGGAHDADGAIVAAAIEAAIRDHNTQAVYQAVV